MVKEDFEFLETLVAVHGVRVVLASVQSICSRVALNVEANWQDVGESARWSRAAHAVRDAIQQISEECDA